jgi:hypothetical protein
VIGPPVAGVLQANLMWKLAAIVGDHLAVGTRHDDALL